VTALRNSIRATYDSRETGPRYHVTYKVDGKVIEWEKPLDDPFGRFTVHLGWRDLLRGLFRRSLAVEVLVGGDPEAVNDVLELDDNALVPNSTRRAAFHSHLNEAVGRMAGSDL
jgi:hypothetical protein